MKIEVQPILDAVKAKGLPLLERDLIIVIDAALGSVKDQALAQPGDAVAGVLGLVLTALQPAIDQQLHLALPDAAK